MAGTVNVVTGQSVLIGSPTIAPGTVPLANNTSTVFSSRVFGILLSKVIPILASRSSLRDSRIIPTMLCPPMVPQSDIFSNV